MIISVHTNVAQEMTDLVSAQPQVRGVMSAERTIWSELAEYVPVQQKQMRKNKQINGVNKVSSDSA